LPLDVTPGRRFVLIDADRVGWIPQTAFMTGIFTLVEEGGKTHYTATPRHWSDEAKAQHETMGVADGWAKGGRATGGDRRGRSTGIRPDAV
jgi:uncharacterized protein YndB with AHSA1/START domain